MKKIYMISGKARSGKDTVANIIKDTYMKNNIKSIILQIAYPLKYYANKVLNWDFSEELKPRAFLQNLGIDVIKKQMGEEFLINRTIEDVQILFNFVDIIIISDARMHIERKKLKENFDVISILVNRNIDNNLNSKEKNHVTESEVEDNYDYIIDNNETKEQLSKRVECIIREEI